MIHQILRKIILISAVVMLSLPYIVLSQSEVTELMIEVRGGGEPVNDALVYVRSEKNNETFQKEMKSNQQGIVRVVNVPCGMVLIQVNAKGWKNFGKRYNLDSKEQTIQIELVKESQSNAFEEKDNNHKEQIIYEDKEPDT